MHAKAQISVEFLIIVIMFTTIFAFISIPLVDSSTEHLKDTSTLIHAKTLLNTVSNTASPRSVTYKVSEALGGEAVICGLKVEPFDTQQIIAEYAVKYRVTFLGDGDSIESGFLLGEDTFQYTFSSGESFELEHESYSESIATFYFNSTLIDEYEEC